jgi:hypothetical protein
MFFCCWVDYLHFFDLKKYDFWHTKNFLKTFSEENNSPDFEKIKKEIVKFLQQVPAITQKYIIGFLTFDFHIWSI